MLNEVANGAAGTGLFIVIAIIGLFAWFLVNRASVRANEQIRLLEALLEEQKRQNQLLKTLVEGQENPAQAAEGATDESDFIRLIPER